MESPPEEACRDRVTSTPVTASGSAAGVLEMPVEGESDPGADHPDDGHTLSGLDEHATMVTETCPVWGMDLKRGRESTP